MRLRFKACFILLFLLVILPVFLLSTQPAFASYAHIVRLKYENNTPVTNATVIFASGEYSYYCDGWGCEKDCSHRYNPCCTFDCAYDTGVTWQTDTDIYGIAVFTMRSGSNVGGASIQRCSTGRNNPFIMAIPYLNSNGYWRFDQISGRSNADQKDDSSNKTELRRRIEDDPEHWHPDCQGYRPNPRFCEDGRYRSCGWSGRGFGGRTNVAKIDVPGEDAPPSKSGNIYWEWTWVGEHLSHDPKPKTENQSLFAFANNLWASFRRVIPF